jgi:hypothetical protein
MSILNGYLQHEKRRPVRETLLQNRNCNIIYGHVCAGLTFKASLMSVAMKSGGHRETVQRLLKAARSQKRE